MKNEPDLQYWDIKTQSIKPDDIYVFRRCYLCEFCTKIEHYIEEAKDPVTIGFFCDELKCNIEDPFHSGCDNFKFEFFDYFGDMKKVIDFSCENGFVIKGFQVTKSKYDAMLKATGCKDENGIIRIFDNLYPETPISTLAILED